MRALVVLAVMLPLFGMAWVLARTVGRYQSRQLEQAWRPTGDLATAVRLLDRCAEADEVMAFLPSDTREEVAAFLRRYHGKQLNA